MQTEHQHGTPPALFVQAGGAMSDPVTCAKCGYLAAKTLKTRELIEADSKFRDGSIPSEGNYYLYDPFPVCIMLAASFEEEIGPNESSFLRTASLIKERECDQFIQWQPGLSPNGHREMKLLQEVERRTNAWRAEDLKWQKQVEALAETRHQELRRDKTSALVQTAIVAVLAAILGGVVQGLIQKLP